MNPTMMNTDAMQPVYPDFTNGTDNRNPVSYRQALAQFDVVHNPRYAPRNNNTYCNIFLWDGSRALGCEIPHTKLFYVVGPDGKPMLSGREFNANAVAEWFAGKEDEIRGWHELEPIPASDRASRGFPTVVIWHNPSGIGHVAWVVPHPVPGVFIAQAGLANFFEDDWRKGFGNKGPLKFYTHD